MFVNSSNKKETGLLIQKEIEDIDTAHSNINIYFTRIRKLVRELGVSEYESNLIYRSEEEKKKSYDEQIKKQSERVNKGLDTIEYFKTVKQMKDRVLQMDFESELTIDNLIDIMIIFCMRVNEIKTLKISKDEN